uniref:tetratricopeptide repeat protein n=1 Tax=Neisseria polysaccharea TaxID=489 RepID=UPI00046DFDD6
YAQAQALLGLMYSKGRGVCQDYVEAVKWYRQAAEQGLAQAQNSLGVMYETGRGVRQDLALAQEWYGKACQNGHQKGCNNYQRLKAGY